MFEIKTGSEMDNVLGKMEKAIYYIRNCATELIDIERTIESLRRDIDNLESALECEINS